MQYLELFTLTDEVHVAAEEAARPLIGVLRVDQHSPLAVQKVSFIARIQYIKLNCGSMNSHE